MGGCALLPLALSHTISDSTTIDLLQDQALVGLHLGPSPQEDQDRSAELGSPTSTVCWNSKALASAQLEGNQQPAVLRCLCLKLLPRLRKKGEHCQNVGKLLSQMGTPTAGTGKQRSLMLGKTTETDQTTSVTVLNSEERNYPNEGGPQPLHQGNTSAMVLWIYVPRLGGAGESCRGGFSEKTAGAVPMLDRASFSQLKDGSTAGQS